MLFRQILLPGSQISRLVRIIRHRLSVPRNHELSNLKLRVRDRAARNTSVRRPVQASVHDIFAPKPPYVVQSTQSESCVREPCLPSITVFTVDVVDKPILGHNEIRRRSCGLRLRDYVAQEKYRVGVRRSHNPSERRRLELPVEWSFLCSTSRFK